MSDSENILFILVIYSKIVIEYLKYVKHHILTGRNKGLFVFETYSVCGRKTAK